MGIDKPALRAPHVLPALAVSLTLMAPSPATAATVTVRPDPDTVSDGFAEPAYDEVHYVAASGEANRLLVAYADDARSVTVSDPGAVITALGSCVSVDQHTARCVRRPGSRVEWLQSTRAELGDGDDEIRTTRPGPAPIGGVVAFGGPGDDLLDGGAGPDRLDGGGGRDTLLGGEDSDVLSDGDRDGAAGDAAPAADVLDGGAGTDELSYAQREQPVRVSLSDGGTDGALGEGDVVSRVEDVTGGGGDDRLVGDDRINRMTGGAGDDAITARGGRDSGGFGDRLEGGPGRDELSGGRGPDVVLGGGGVDSLECGGGRDLVWDPRGGEILPSSCETMSFSFGVDDENTLTLAPHPRRSTSSSATFVLSCPDFEDRDGELSECRGTLTLREATGRRRLLGRARFADAARRESFGVRVSLTELGRRRARRTTGVVSTASLRGRNLPRGSWSLVLRTRR